MSFSLYSSNKFIYLSEELYAVRHSKVGRENVKTPFLTYRPFSIHCVLSSGTQRRALITNAKIIEMQSHLPNIGIESTAITLRHNGLYMTLQKNLETQKNYKQVVSLVL